MPAPVAVSPSNPLPGLWLTVDLKAAPPSPGSQGLKCCVLSCAETGEGDQTADTEIRPVYSEDDVRTAQGNSMAFFLYRKLFGRDKTAQVDLVKVTESGGNAATNTLTFSGTPTTDCSWRVWVHGFSVDVFWNVGDAATVARDDAVAALGEYADYMFATFAAGSGGVVNGTARTKGPCGNDIKLRVKQLTGAGGSLAVGGANFSGGTTEPNFTTALATIAGREYDYIVVLLSNADAQAASGGNTARLKTHIGNNVQGLAAKLQQGIYASTGSIAAAKTNTAAENFENFEHLCSVNDESLPCEWAGWEVGDRMKRRKLQINANRIGEEAPEMAGSADKVADNPTEAEAIDALNNGVTLVGYTASGTPYVIRPITTYHQDAQGNQDRRVFDLNEVDTMYDYAKDLRAFIQQTYHSSGNQVHIARDREEGDEELPAYTVEERDVKASIVQRTRAFWIPKGAIQGPAFNEAVEDGSFICEVDDGDDTQLDIFLPAKVNKNWAKTSLVAAKVG